MYVFKAIYEIRFSFNSTRNSPIFPFSLKLISPIWWGSWNLQLLVSLSCKRYIPNVVKIVVFWEGVNARRTTHDEQKPIGKDHSGDLIRSLQAVMVIRVSKKMYRHIYTPPFIITNEKNDKFAPCCFSKFNICQRIYRQHINSLSFLFPSISSWHYLTIQTN